MMIPDFDTRFGGRSLFEHALRNPSASGVQGFPSDEVAVVAPLKARVNYGRWIVDCPQPGCHGAELARAEGFWCCECRNTAQQGKPLPVVFPAKRTAIETLLLARPHRFRNWLPGETIAQLQAENAKGGDV